MEGRALTARQAGDSLHQARVERCFKSSTGVARMRRAGPVVGEGQRLDAGEGLPPVRQLAIELPTFEPGPLPGRPVGVLDGRVG